MQVSQVQGQKVHSLIVPLRQQNLILPQAVLAEVISMPELRKLEGTDDWFIGVFDWRGRQVPLISVEQLCNIGNPAHINRSRRIAVLYGIEGIAGVEHYAIEIQAIPHPVLLGEADLLTLDGAVTADGAVLAQHVQAVGIKGFLPDLSALEERLREQMQKL
jgi:chemosensory pili system protein ChpC